MISKNMSIDDAHALPTWRRPIALLALMAFTMQMAYATWSALLNNFVHERAGFDGSDLGWLQSMALRWQSPRGSQPLAVC